jgi:hypothetical protein
MPWLTIGALTVSVFAMAGWCSSEVVKNVEFTMQWAKQVGDDLVQATQRAEGWRDEALTNKPPAQHELELPLGSRIAGQRFDRLALQRLQACGSLRTMQGAPIVFASTQACSRHSEVR